MHLGFGNELIITSEEVKQSRVSPLLLPPTDLWRVKRGSWIFTFKEKWLETTATRREELYPSQLFLHLNSKLKTIKLNTYMKMAVFHDPHVYYLF